ncbi:MAG: DMT family transporter [Rhodospirillaceae bacterium]
MSDSSSTPSAGHAYLLLTGTATCWAFNAIFGQLAVGEVSPMALVGFRWVLVVAMMGLVARKHVIRDWPVLKSRLWFVGFAGMLGFTVFNGLFYIAAHGTSGVNVGILQGSIPVFVLLGAFIMFRTPVTWMQAAGVAVTLVGVVAVAVRGDLDLLVALAINWGDALMLLACVIYAGYTVALRKRPQVSPLGMFTVMAVFALLTAIPLVGIEIALGQFQIPTPKGWGVIVLVALFPSFIAQIFFIQGVGIIGPGRAGIFVNLVPIFAAALAVLVLGEPFEPYHLAALVLVLGGIWISEKGKSSNPA